MSVFIVLFYRETSVKLLSFALLKVVLITQTFFFQSSVKFETSSQLTSINA